MNANLNNLVKNIEQNGFYSWLTKRIDYDGSCPCFLVELPDLDLEIRATCWRVSVEFEYSGLSIKDFKNQYDKNDLDYLANLILEYVTEIWSNTDFEYSINGHVKKFTILPKYEQTR
jgi:hypothetical protein